MERWTVLAYSWSLRRWLPARVSDFSWSSQLKFFLHFQDRNENKIVLLLAHAQRIYKLYADNYQNLGQDLKWEIDLTSSQKYIFSCYFNKNLPKLLLIPFDCYHERLVGVWSLNFLRLGRTSPRIAQFPWNCTSCWPGWTGQDSSEKPEGQKHGPRTRMCLQMKRRAR